MTVLHALVAALVCVLAGVVEAQLGASTCGAWAPPSQEGWDRDPAGVHDLPLDPDNDGIPPPRAASTCASRTGVLAAMPANVVGSVFDWSMVPVMVIGGLVALLCTTCAGMSAVMGLLVLRPAQAQQVVQAVMQAPLAQALAQHFQQAGLGEAEVVVPDDAASEAAAAANAYPITLVNADGVPGSECVVCKEAPNNVVVVPCGHMVCRGCALRCRANGEHACVHCRVRIERVMPYLP